MKFLSLVLRVLIVLQALRASGCLVGVFYGTYPVEMVLIPVFQIGSIEWIENAPINLNLEALFFFKIYFSCLFYIYPFNIGAMH